MARQPAREEPTQTVHDELLDAAMEVDTNFGAKHSKETDQVYLKRLVVSLSEAPDSVWNELSEEAQNWFNEATDQMNAHKNVPVPEGYEPTPAREPRRATGPEAAAERQTSRRRSAEPEPEEEAPSRRRRAAAAEEPAEEDAPRSRRRAADPEPEAAAEEDAPRTRRSRAADPEPEPEAAPRSRRRAAAEAEPEADPEPAPRGRRRAAAEPEPEAAPRGRGRAAAEEGTSRRRAPAEATSARSSGGGDAVGSAASEIRRMLIRNPKLTNEQVRDKLEDKGIQAKPVSINATRIFTLGVIAEAQRQGKWLDDARR